MSGNSGRSPVQWSDSPSAAAPFPATARWSGSVPVVTVMSTTGTPFCTRAARAIDAVRPVFSQVTSTSAGPSCGTRRKLALVATGYGFGAVSSTARSTVAISTPPFTAGGALLPGATTMANRGSAWVSYRPSLRLLTAVASSNNVIQPHSSVRESWCCTLAAGSRRRPTLLASGPELALQPGLGLLERPAVCASRQVLPAGVGD